MINITKDTIIGDILDVAPQTAPIFLSIGMHCLGCPSSRGETVEEACMVHGVDPAGLLHGLTMGSHAAQAVHTRVQKDGHAALGRIVLQDFGNDGITGNSHGNVPFCIIQNV